MYLSLLINWFNHRSLSFAVEEIKKPSVGPRFPAYQTSFIFTCNLVIHLKKLKFELIKMGHSGLCFFLQDVNSRNFIADSFCF